MDTKKLDRMARKFDKLAYGEDPADLLCVITSLLAKVAMTGMKLTQEERQELYERIVSAVQIGVMTEIESFKGVNMQDLIANCRRSVAAKFRKDIANVK